MSNKYYRIFGSLTALGALAACGGGSTSNGVSISSGEAARQIFATDQATLAAALDAGEIVSARSIATSSLLRNYDEQSSSLVDDTLIQIQKNADGELTVIVNGNEVAFSEADQRAFDGEVFGYEQDGDNFYFSLFNWDGNLEDLLTSDENAQPISFYYEEVDSPTGLTGFAIVGSETGPELPPGDATYNGYSVVTIFPEENLTSFGDTRQRLRSNVSMTVDFEEEIISGTMSNLEFQEPPNEGDERFAIDGEISMDETSFNSNGFTGSLTLDSAAQEATAVATAEIGTYSGTFYGEDAASTAGTITMQAEDNEDGEMANGYGFFITDK